MATDKEPEAMAQIHKIRQKIYEETRNLTDEEILRRTKKSAEHLKGRHHLNISRRDAAGKRT